MTDDKTGTLRMQPSGQWAIQVPGREPVNIVAGEVFAVLMPGKRIWQMLHMEQCDGHWHAVVSRGRAERRVELRDGLRAWFFDLRERNAKPLRAGED